ncbi:Pimeloyl-ACP methyl ester carboxylesterase [Filimonas lacunae]|uniref:Pimeloyl-ACP methyl ester carboxylesterase n=1 Tax=Filimonas lacunae TaxID=477680 RepID=A0A173MPV9_9BACT|nr:alpha/beta hydrolase [Filimonas lacunae]BAV09507.1 hydrolase, alpha/beta fold family [Filimonas lacunae]SIS74399.1 Pimeloyl-ACP methyl ester carboxylesterase [Filimonas lacunae]
MEISALTAETQFAPINGNQIAYRVLGQGPYLLMYNRFRGVLDTWDPLFIDTLAGSNTVVLFDYPGIGDSAGMLPEDMTVVANTGVSLMSHLGVNTFSVAGWSYGGLAAQAALFLHPQQIIKAVLIGTNPVGQNEIPLDTTFLEYAFKPVNTLEDEYVLFFEPAQGKSLAAANASHERIAQRLVRGKIPVGMETYQYYSKGAAMMREDKAGFRAQYASLQAPVLVISGDHDISFPVENWFSLLRTAPSIQHIIVHGSGHGPQHQEPELIAGYMNLFLNRPA